MQETFLLSTKAGSSLKAVTVSEPGAATVGPRLAQHGDEAGVRR